jgi:hypothetical protein
MRDFHTKAKEAGFQTADSFDQFDRDAYSQLAEMRKSGVDLGRLKSMSQLLADNKAEKNGDSEFDPESFKSSIMGDFEKRLASERAEGEYRGKRDSVSKQIRDFARELLGEDAHDLEVDVMSEGLNWRSLLKGRPFEKDHPLHDKYGIDVPDEATLKEVFEEFKKARTRETGEEIAKVGDKANKAKATAAGAASDQGAAKEADTSAMSMEQLLDHEASKIKLPAR